MNPTRSVTDADDVVILVDERDATLGVAPKLAAHRDGRLHRAVSVVLFDDRGRVLLQRRADQKYHSPGLWSNSCCGHPRPGESVEDAARRRLDDELGIHGCPLRPAGRFMYFADLGGGLVEHELDHVVVGDWGGVTRPNPQEVAEVRWADPAVLLAEAAETPQAYTAWAAAVIGKALRARAVDAVSTGG